jgi:Carboxypeptidase regulatory-like domain
MFKIYFILAVLGLSMVRCTQPNKSNQPTTTDKSLSAMNHTIKGQLVDAQNRPIANANIAITEGPDSFIEIATITDAQGFFQLTAGQKAGIYTIGVSSNDGTKKIPVTLPQTQDREIFVLK